MLITLFATDTAHQRQVISMSSRYAKPITKTGQRRYITGKGLGSKNTGQITDTYKPLRIGLKRLISRSNLLCFSSSHYLPLALGLALLKTIVDCSLMFFPVGWRVPAPGDPYVLSSMFLLLGWRVLPRLFDRAFGRSDFFNPYIVTFLF